MNSQQLLYIYFGIGLFFVLYFFVFRGKPRQPTKLNLKAPSSATTPNEAERSEKVARVLEAKKEITLPEPVEAPPQLPEPKKVEEVKVLPPPPVVPVPPKKESRVFFVYNAHEWEAHEVLGVDYGTTLQQATEKYQQLIKTADPSTFEFYESAFQAILKKKGSR